MVPTFFAIGPAIYVVIPLMVIVPVCMILIVRQIAGAFGDDSLRLRTSSPHPKPKKRSTELDDEI